MVSGVGMAMSIVTTVAGQPAIMTTLAADIAASTGWPLKTVLMTQPISWAMTLFAYQIPPLILAAHLGGMFDRVNSDQARATLLAAWDGGVRFFDTAP